MPLRLVMMATGEFALPTFRDLLDSEHTLLSLYTQPERASKGAKPVPNPLKELAIYRGIPVLHPEKVNLPENLAELERQAPDVIVVAAYGQILSRKLLAIPKQGIINVHASLLPKYRGAAPINYAIWDGEKESGVTIIWVVPELDAGPMLAKEATPIDPLETTGTLEPKLGEIGSRLTREVLLQIENGTMHEVPQDPKEVTFAPKLNKALGNIDWHQPATRVDCQIRAFQPWPTPYSFLHQSGKPARRFVIRLVKPLGSQSTETPGTVLEVGKGNLAVACGAGIVSIEEIQPEGKRSMKIEEFLRGYPIHKGDQFRSGSES